MNIRWIPSPNFTSGRPGGYQPLLIVCHIMAGTLEGTRSWFANPQSRVSAHFGVGKQGEIDQYVRISDTAWHAGSLRNPLVELPYPSRIGPNLYSIGIEFEGHSGDPFPETQYQAGLELIRDLLRQMPASVLPIQRRLIGHYQINSVDRRDDPGPTFPWARLYADLAAGAVSPGPRVLVESTGHVFPAIVQDGVMYAPVRALLEDLYYRVDYDGETKTAVVRQ